ncbi:O-antigen ligase family protein [Microbacterium marinilacus]|nr:O-antigen ligase family protein [Microbacterium marinilacus]MBY0690061.1 O-antigen ligase family protein [Microbacterium marinilacus]
MWTTRARTTLRAALPWTAGALALGATGVGIGVLAVHATALVVPAALAVLLTGLAAMDRSLIPVLSVPATLVLVRVGGALSVSDVVLVLATVAALLTIRAREARPMQPLLWAGAVYLAAAVPVQILHPYAANIVEWLHEVVLVLGSMVVGFAIGRQGRARLALSLYLVACSAIGVWAAVVAVLGLAQTGAFTAVYLPELHKNTIGGMLAVAVVIAFARPVWLGWSRRWAWAALLICAVGVLAAQSRQGLVGAVVGVLFVALRPRPQTGRRSGWVWLAALPAAVYVVGEVNTQLSSDNTFNSAYQRLSWYEDALRIWEQSPVFGVGLRWWYTDRFEARFQPPNAELEVLTSTGVVGLVGFLLMFAVALWHLVRMDPVYGTVGAAVVLTRFAQAQFDLYWVAGQASLLWIVAGICYGVQARDRAAADAMPPPPQTTRRQRGSRAPRGAAVVRS